jgi:Zn-dependent protease
MQPELIFWVIVVIFSVILHEVAHGYMANYLGDPTARLQGRLTLNPLVHVDPFGSIILPALMVFGHLMPIGYAKPVPYNPQMARYITTRPQGTQNPNLKVQVAGTCPRL